MKIIVSVILTIAAIAVIGVVYMYSGSYNVSAMEHEGGIARWVLNTTRRNSINSRIKDIKVPDLNNDEMISEGLSHYKEMCATCHGAPGEAETELAKGLNPDAPDLVKFGNRIPPEKIFWVTKNGIRMTGMPAWGPTHSDDKIWDIVAAVRKLNQISPSKYSAVKVEEEGDDY